MNIQELRKYLADILDGVTAGPPFEVGGKGKKVLMALKQYVQVVPPAAAGVLRILLHDNPDDPELMS